MECAQIGSLVPKLESWIVPKLEAWIVPKLEAWDLEAIGARFWRTLVGISIKRPA